MKRIVRIGGLLVAFGAPVAHSQVINFHYGHNYAAGAPGYADIIYSGQGAYSDPGNNLWNGFGPGYTANTGPNFTSSGAATPVTFSLGSGTSANGGIWLSGNGTSNPNQGTPFFLLGYASLVNSANPGQGTAGAPMGTFSLGGVPAGTYSLYLYGANYDADRGAVFSLSSGTAHNGINGSDNNGNNNAFGEGINFVRFDNVVPNAGIITGSWIPNPNSTLLGEGNFNGLQLVLVPEPGGLALLALGAAGLIFLRRRE
jgi:hypothetical protein